LIVDKTGHYLIASESITMSLAAPEDAASVLEQFVHDVANTPAEITHLLEEIQAKDLQIAAFKEEISKRDNQLQRWVRQNGGNVLNPKEEAFARTINDCYDKCEILQAEKCGLAEKALIVLERQIRRLDVGLRGLQIREEFPADWGGPSLLSGSQTGVSTPVPGNSSAGPLQAVSGNIGTTGGAPSIANAAQMRMAQSSQAARSGQQAPTAAMPRSQRESSTDASKRRRLNQSIGTLPTASSNLRQSSLGPGTPKAGTPGPTAISRAGSAQPPRAGAANKKIAPPGKKAPPQQGQARDRNKNRPGTKKAGDRRRALARDRATPSTNASLSDEEDDSASPTPSSLPRSQHDGTSDRHRHPDDDEDEDDGQLYCYCQKVSYGDMVGCDNDNCEYQWFHWGCVGLKGEPEGEWLCPTCRKLPRKDLVISKA
jgi:inhibitor of growth protein 3